MKKSWIKKQSTFIFEMCDAKFIEDVGLSGSEHHLEVMFEEQYVNIPTIFATDCDKVYLPNIIQSMNQENIENTIELELDPMEVQKHYSEDDVSQ